LSRSVSRAIFITRSDRPSLLSLTGHPGCRAIGADTVVLTGHFDTVHIEAYGDLRPLALDPERPAPALLAHLADAADASGSLARADLASGRFLPGRGRLATRCWRQLPPIRHDKGTCSFWRCPRGGEFSRRA
jgi:hypothetical protein